MSFNIHHGVGTDGVLSLRRIADVIINSGADLVGLQEVDRHYGERSAWADQAAELARLTGYRMIFGANLDESPPAGQCQIEEQKQGQKQKQRRQYGTAILSRPPIVAWDNTALYLGAGNEQRGLLRATIDVAGQQWCFCTTHLAVESAAARARQVAELLTLIDADAPTVVVGDFNAHPDDPEIGSLTAVLTDAWAMTDGSAGTGRGNGFSFPSDRPTVRIDYILTGGDVRPVGTEVVDRWPQASDHRPVLSRLRLVPSGAKRH